MWCLPSFAPRRFATGIILLLFLLAPLLSRAESSIVFMPTEESKYLLKGEGFKEIGAITLTVDYDTTYLFSPQVNVMGGKLLEEDGGEEQPPGTLRLQIVNEDRNDVFEVTVYFQKRGDYPPVVNFVTAEVTDLSGAPRPVPVVMMAPVNPPRNEDMPAAPTPARDPAAPLADRAAEGSMRENGVTADELSPVAPPAAAPAMALPVTQADSMPEIARKKTVAERFRNFSGRKSLAAFTALFSGADPCCRQIPPVMVADGRRTARVVIGGVEEEDGAPLFTVSGGRLISVERGARDKEWVVVVQPDEKAWEVSVSCAAANGTIDFPLTVAPAIDIPRRKLAELDEKSFMPRLRSFLAVRPARGKAKSPVWFREYLFTANYLAAQEDQKKDRRK